MHQSILCVFTSGLHDLNIIQNKLEAFAGELRSQGYIVNTDIFQFPND